MIAGRIWYELADFACMYRAEYVNTFENIADCPSRQQLDYLLSSGAVEVTDFTWPVFSGGLEGWMTQEPEVVRVLE